jgi:hypothetical protein
VNSTVGVKLLDQLASSGPGWFLKGFAIVGLLMYTFFALVVVRQVGVMTETFESEVNGTVKMFAWAHLLLSGFLLLVAVVML